MRRPPPRTASNRASLLEFLSPRSRAVLLTRRRTGGVQLSPPTYGVDGGGRIVVSTYPQRAKVINARRAPEVSVCVLSRSGTALLRMTVTGWGPVATGGCPPGWSTSPEACISD